MNDSRSHRHAPDTKPGKMPQSSYEGQPVHNDKPSNTHADVSVLGNIDWSNAEAMSMPKKTLISIRLDDDIIAFFKQAGSGYQTRINAVLRHFMEYQRRKRPGDQD